MCRSNRRARVRISMAGSIALVAVLVVLQATPPRAQASEPLGRDSVWVLDNLDPDYEVPPFGDSLTAFTPSGQVLMTAIGLNQSQTVGGGRILAVEPEGRWAIVAPDVSSNLIRIGADGETDWALALPLWAGAVALAADGYAYALDTNGSIVSTSIIKIDPVTGDVVADPVEQGGYDLVVDSTHDRIWVVGGDIKALRAESLTLEQAIASGGFAVSVDYTSDGSAWVAVRDLYGSEDRLLRVSPSGAVTNEIVLDGDPSCVAVDRSDDSVWVTTYYGVASLRKYAANGTSLASVPNVDGWTVRVDPSDATAWVSERDGTVSHFGRDGTLLDSFAGPAGDPQRTTWLELPFPEPIVTACNDGQDNDQDGLIDHPEDPDCVEPLAKSENPACADEVDNDGDGVVDYPDDPGCSGVADLSEQSVVIVSAECLDGVDNDGDGLVDYFADPGCFWFDDSSEHSADLVCDDGLDNDGDGFVDFPADPACQRADSPREDTQCQDGIDNDHDGKRDFDGGASLNGGIPLAAPDPQCADAPSRNNEQQACGLGAEIAVLLLAVARLRARH